MDNNERQLISQFLDQLVQVKGMPKDSEIDTMIRSAASKQPDALYLLVQKALIQDQALKQAAEQMQQLHSENESLRSQNPDASQRSNSGFFSGGSLFGGNNSRNFNNGNNTPSQNQGYAPQASSSPMSGFLANAATTAVGVAGGSFLVSGLTNLFGGGNHGDGGSFLSNDNQGSYDYQQPADNVTVNNYYDNQDPDADLFNDL